MINGHKTLTKICSYYCDIDLLVTHMIIVTEMFVTERRKGSTVRRPEHLIMTVNAHRIYDPGRATSDVFCSVFNAVSLPALASDLKRDQLNLYTTGELLVLLSQLRGDFNHDGTIDAVDIDLPRLAAGVTIRTPAAMHVHVAFFRNRLSNQNPIDLDRSSFTRRLLRADRESFG